MMQERESDGLVEVRRPSPSGRLVRARILGIPAIWVIEVKDRVSLIFRECHPAIHTVGDVLDLFLGFTQRKYCHQTSAAEKTACVLRVNNRATRKYLSIWAGWNRDR